MSHPSDQSLLDPSDTFVRRHLGSSTHEKREMLDVLGCSDLETLANEAVPASIRVSEPLAFEHLSSRAPGETEMLARLAEMAGRNQVMRSLIGMGYADCLVPPVIQRNVLENPGWYTQYTPYQAEISQGRLEALLNFQTMISDLTALPVAGASLLDEATAAGEALAMAYAAGRRKRGTFYVAEGCHPQTVGVLATRAEGFGIELQQGSAEDAPLDGGNLCGILLSYPATDGAFSDWRDLIARAKAAGVIVVMATDLLALTLLTPPGELGADIAVGSAQRFGVPFGYGGPHPAFLATTEKLKRQLPGRVIGVSRDRRGRTALRMAMQTREQHIRREKATSNICTAQVLLAVMAGMYGVYHGPDGLTRIARRIRTLTQVLAEGLRHHGCVLANTTTFDTVRIQLDSARHGDADAAMARAVADGFNLRKLDETTVGLTLDEKTDRAEVSRLWHAITGEATDLTVDALAAKMAASGDHDLPAEYARTSPFLEHPVFHTYRTEHEMLRYLRRLESRDLSLTTSMIPLGSCTMKLNGTSEMIPVTWPEIGGLHPFAPLEQAQGYRQLFDQLESWLNTLTGFDAFTLQPNAGAQGEYTGLMLIRAFHQANGEAHRNVCLIPVSAHGTNPASAVMAGMKVVVVACDDQGNVDLDDVRAKAEAHAENLAALMITYPSTHGVFEEGVRDVCATVHAHGGQVYLDGANMNAQVGLCRPGDYGADVCHLNLHKTFCIPHGGGGPGMGPVGVKAHLAPFLPGHPVIATGGEKAIGPISAAPWGSASILPISWMYIALMGADGLTQATRLAILHANYMADRLGEHYEVLYRGSQGRVAHEFIIDLRPFKKTSGIEAEDVAKRLMDYGFHAPTMSFPVVGTLMIEPTESESKAELDRLCDALIAIRKEIQAIRDGELDRDDNPLKNAPHTADEIASDDWSHPYPRRLAAYPAPWLDDHKFWPTVSRVDNAFGDRHFICTCPPIEDYA